MMPPQGRMRECEAAMCGVATVEGMPPTHLCIVQYQNDCSFMQVQGVTIYISEMQRYALSLAPMQHMWM